MNDNQNNKNSKNTSETFSKILNKSADISKKIAKGTYESTQSTLNKSADISKKIAKGAYESAQSTAKKIKENNEANKKKKLAPVFPSDYKSKNFHIPNIIKIVDDAVRRGNEFCEGAIGWREPVNNTEVLFLYDEAKKISGLQFVPTFNCDAIYCVDPFDRKRFIKADCIFSKTQEEKLAELENIAYCLGAKSCSIELVYAESETKTLKKSFAASVGKDIGTSGHSNTSQGTVNSNSGKTVVAFEGHNSPIRPTLKWFTYDDTIKNLIDMRCKNPSSVKSRTLEIAGSSSSTMSRETAASIDCLLKKSKVHAGIQMEYQSNKELNSKLIFNIEF